MLLSVANKTLKADWHYVECCYVECRYAECRYAECRYAECRYAECRGALFMHLAISGRHKIEHEI